MYDMWNLPWKIEFQHLNFHPLFVFDESGVVFEAGDQDDEFVDVTGTGDGLAREIGGTGDAFDRGPGKGSWGWRTGISS